MAWRMSRLWCLCVFLSQKWTPYFLRESCSRSCSMEYITNNPSIQDRSPTKSSIEYIREWIWERHSMRKWWTYFTLKWNWWANTTTRLNLSQPWNCIRDINTVYRLPAGNRMISLLLPNLWWKMKTMRYWSSRTEITLKMTLCCLTIFRWLIAKKREAHFLGLLYNKIHEQLKN